MNPAAVWSAGGGFLGAMLGNVMDSPPLLTAVLVGATAAVPLVVTAEDELDDDIMMTLAQQAAYGAVAYYILGMLPLFDGNKLAMGAFAGYIGFVIPFVAFAYSASGN